MTLNDKKMPKMPNNFCYVNIIISRKNINYVCYDKIENNDAYYKKCRINK